MKMENGRLEQNFSSDSSLTEQFIDRYFTPYNSLRFKVILVISKGGCLFKKISSLISSKRRIQARKYMKSFMKKIQFSYR